MTAGILLFSGCNSNKQNEQTTAELQQKINQSFQSTAKVRYGEFETVMTIYRKPMNCAEVVFVSPDTLKDIKLVFYTDKVAVRYKELAFDFDPESMPGQALGNLVISSINTALEDEGVQIRQENSQLIVSGQIAEGDFYLVVDSTNGNILKLAIPDSDLEMEILNFKILE